MATKTVQNATPVPANRSRILFGGAVAFILAAGLTTVLLLKGNKTSSAWVDTASVQVTGVALPAFPEDPAVADPARGLPAPVLIGLSGTGTSITVPVPGKRTLVVVVAHWCPHCQREVPRLVQLQNEGKIPADLNVVMVSTAVRTDAPNYPPSAWLANEKVTFPVMIDSKQGDALVALGGMGFPNLHLIGADGKVIARNSGELEPDALAAFVQQ
jgi:cytochrome c biogenesis protein CcmG, thiol:disulfide interchange protein DsbE